MAALRDDPPSSATARWSNDSLVTHRRRFKIFKKDRPACGVMVGAIERREW